MSLSGQSGTNSLKSVSGLQQVKADTIEASEFTVDTLTVDDVSVSGTLTSFSNFNLGNNLLQGDPTATTPSVACTGDLHVNTIVRASHLVTGGVECSGNISGTIVTPNQNNIKSVGRLNNLDVSGNIQQYSGTCIFKSLSVSGNTLTQGYLGINTTVVQPNKWLHVVGDSYFNGNLQIEDTKGIDFKGSLGTKLNFYYDAYGIGLSSYSQNYFSSRYHRFFQGGSNNTGTLVCEMSSDYGIKAYQNIYGLDVSCNGNMSCNGSLNSPLANLGSIIVKDSATFQGNSTLTSATILSATASTLTITGTLTSQSGTFESSNTFNFNNSAYSSTSFLAPSFYVRDTTVFGVDTPCVPEIYYVNYAERSFLNNTTAQRIFGSAGSNPKCYLKKGTYTYELWLPLRQSNTTSSNTSHAVNIGLGDSGVGNAYYTHNGIVIAGRGTTAPYTFYMNTMGGSQGSAYPVTGQVTAISGSNVNTPVLIRGYMNVTTAGPIWPYFQETASINLLYNLGIGAYMKIWRMGTNNTDVYAGDWA